MTGEQRSLLGWTAAVALFTGLFALGSLATALRAETQDLANDPRFAELQQKLQRKGQPGGHVKTVLQQSTDLAKSTAPLQAAALGPYALGMLLLGAAALWARRDPGKARYIAPVAVLAVALRLALAAVELHVAALTSKMMTASVAAGMAAGSGGKPMPRWLDATMEGFGALMAGELYVSTIAWAVALAGFYGWVAYKFWGYSPASLRPL